MGRMTLSGTGIPLPPLNPGDHLAKECGGEGGPLPPHGPKRQEASAQEGLTSRRERRLEAPPKQEVHDVLEALLGRGQGAGGGLRADGAQGMGLQDPAAKPLWEGG